VFDAGIQKKTKTSLDAATWQLIQAGNYALNQLNVRLARPSRAAQKQGRISDDNASVRRVRERLAKYPTRQVQAQQAGPVELAAPRPTPDGSFFACRPSRAQQLQGGIFSAGASVRRVRERLAKFSNAAGASAAGLQAKKRPNRLIGPKYKSKPEEEEGVLTFCRGSKPAAAAMV